MPGFIDTPGKDTSPVWLPPRVWSVDGGSPAITQTTLAGYQHGVAAYAFDAASAESVVHTAQTPDGWNTVDVTLWWVNLSTGTGDVVWRLAHQQLSDGDDTSAGGVVAASVTATAQARFIVETTTLASGVSVARIMHLAVQRIGGDAADTLGNDAGMVGLRLTKAS